MSTREPTTVRVGWRWLVVLLVAAGTIQTSASVQSSLRGLEEHLDALFPTAARFSGKTGTPPHIRAFQGEGDAEKVIGFIFSTLDVEPLERGYEGVIEMLLGLEPDGKITGLRIIAHREPYGYFSIDLPEFARQFEGKSVLERFRVGEDVDGVTTATITVTSATRVIRKSARRIARQFLTENGGSRR